MNTIFKDHFRWFIILLLFMICVINYIDRASLSFAIPIIDHEFHFSEKEKGLLLGAFGIGYIFSTFIGGILADKYGAKVTLAYSAILWSIATILFAVSNHFMTFIFSRILLGFSEGPVFPCLARAIQDWLPKQQRVRALSVSLMSVPFSLAISGPIVSELIIFTSWRETYIILGLISICWIPFWLYYFTNQAKDSRFVNTAEKQYIGNPPKPQKNEPIHFIDILKNKTLMVNNLAFLNFGFYLFFFITWLPSYLETQFHLSIRGTAYFTVIPWLTALFFMYIIGHISDQLLIKTQSYRIARTYPILIMQCLQACCLIPLLIWSQNITIVLISICLAVGFTMGPNGIYFSINSDITQSRSASSAGIMDLFFASAGFIAPTLTGVILNDTQNYNMVFYGLIFVSIVTIILIYIFHNKK